MLLENLPKFAETDRVAIVCAAEEMSYRTLWERVRALAWFLKDNYPSRRPLAICGDRENDIVVGIFAALLAAKPYVVISDSYPEDRIRHILTHCEAELILTASRREMDFALPVIPASEIDAFVARYGDRAAPTVSYQLDDTACIMYTSGSTGEPKGVEISYRNVEKKTEEAAKPTAAWVASNLPEPSVYCACSLFPYFSAASTEYFGILCEYGGLWYTVSAEVATDPEKLFLFMKDAQPTWFSFSPTLAKNLFAFPEFNSDTLPSLRLAFYGGEAVPPESIRELRKRFPNILVYNAYGATEVLATCSTCLITDELLRESSGHFPIDDGERPVLILVDENGKQITEEGRVGELAFRGDMVAKGYYKDSALTKKAFFTLSDGTRAYRTGDLGVLRGGYTYTVGRKDNQVKVGANRIELEDVEAHLLQCTAVRDCAVTVGTDEYGVKNLVAYVVPTPEAAGQKRLDVFLQIKTEMMASVESYKVPQKIVFLDELPRNANGKVDRLRLRKMADEKQSLHFA